MTDDHPMVPGPVAARDLMLERFARISVESTLRDARATLADLQSDPDMPNVLVAVDEDDRYQGILTARMLLENLLSGWRPSAESRTGETRRERELLALAAERSNARIADILVRELPVAAPDDRLVPLIQLGCERHLEFIPIVEDLQPLGVVPIAAVLTAAATLALRPDDEGIQVDGKAIK